MLLHIFLISLTVATQINAMEPEVSGPLRLKKKLALIKIQRAFADKDMEQVLALVKMWLPILSDTELQNINQCLLETFTCESEPKTIEIWKRSYATYEQEILRREKTTQHQGDLPRTGDN